jgi:hypothetical protein
MWEYLLISFRISIKLRFGGYVRRDMSGKKKSPVEAGKRASIVRYAVLWHVLTLN